MKFFGRHRLSEILSKYAVLAWFLNISTSTGNAVVLDGGFLLVDEVDKRDGGISTEVE